MPTITVIQPTLTEEKIQIQRVAAYCRVSSDSEDQLHSFAAQMRHYTQAFSDSAKEILVDVYADEGISGITAAKRTEFQRMLKDCRSGKIDRIITKSISRFARNTKECLETVRELRSLGVTIHFEKEGIDTANTADEFMITLMGGLAQEESRSISQNMKWSYQKRMQKGAFITNTPPFGYKKCNEILQIEWSEAVIVQDIFRYYLCGNGIRRTTQYCNEKYRNQRTWTYSSVRYLLTNEKYIGDTLLQKYYTPDLIGARNRENKGNADQYYIQNTHPPIIPREDFEKVQQLLKSNDIQRQKRQVYPFTKKLQCGSCGAYFQRKMIREKAYWTCSRHNISAENCPMQEISEIAVYDAFLRLFHKLKRNYNHIFPPLFSQLQALKDRRYAGNQQYLQFSQEIIKCKEQIHVLTRLRSKGFLDEKKFLEQTTALQSKISRQQKKLCDVTKSEDDDQQTDKLKEVATTIENAPNLLTNFNAELFDVLVEKITVTDRKTIKFHLHGGLIFTEEIV